MTIYIDVVLIENLLMNYIILLATGIVLKVKIRKVRLFIASLIGSIYSILTYIVTIQIYSNFLLKLVLSIIIVYIAFSPQNVKNMWKNLLVFYMISFVFGGAAFALIYIIKPQEILMKNGLFLGIYPLKTVLLAGIIGFIIVIITFRIVKNKITKNDILKKIRIMINQKQIELNAMIDTGNMLKDPITNSPVIVVEKSILYEVLPKEFLDNLEKILGGDFDNIPLNIKEDYIHKIKYIPFSSLGKQNGMLVGLRPLHVEIIEEDKIFKITNVTIGIYNKSLTRDGKYRALMGIDMI